MSWTVYLSPESSLATYDLNAFVPRGARIISDHVAIADARDAVEAYRARQEREAAEAAWQRDLFKA